MLAAIAGFPGASFQKMNPSSRNLKIPPSVGKSPLCSLISSIEGWRTTGGNLNLPYLKDALAEALSRQGDVETGLRLLDECLGQIERPGWHERVWLAEILRLKDWVAGVKAGARRPRRNFERQSNMRAGSKPDHRSCAVRRRSLNC
jgi:hypothetical protein